MKRYSIMVRYPQQNRLVEMLQVENDPEVIAQALRNKTLVKGVAIYEQVSVVDNHQRSTGEQT